MYTIFVLQMNPENKPSVPYLAARSAKDRSIVLQLLHAALGYYRFVPFYSQPFISQMILDFQN